MTNKKIVISGTGCALADYLYRGISFNGPGFRKYSSVATGDGGLTPGKLVFTEELEKFSGSRYPLILAEITGNRTPDAFNIGGPSLVSMIHAAQMLDSDSFKVNFYGMTGNDLTAGKIFDILHTTPLGVDNYLNTGAKATPFTDVFSDPDYDGGHGERTFVNNIGAAWEFSPANLGSDFFRSDIVCFGGTALVPQIHDNLSSLLSRSKTAGALTVVNTVFDFRNEKSQPGKNWPLVNTPKDYGLIDILIMDCEEAVKISGKNNIEEAAASFSQCGVASFIITNGARDLYAGSSGKLFGKTGLLKLPVSEMVKQKLLSSPDLRGDTTGCGDNFAGGIISSVALQMKSGKRTGLDFIDALSLGVASGGLTCFITGGTYHENHIGEKRNNVVEIQREYLHQIS